MQVTVITKRGQSLTEYLTLFGITQSIYPTQISGTSDVLTIILSKKLFYYPLNYNSSDLTSILSKFIAPYPLTFEVSESQGNLISVFLEDYPLEASESGLERLSFRTNAIYPIELPGAPPVTGNSFVGNAINQIPFGIEIIFPQSFNGISINNVPFKITLANSNEFLGNYINGIPFGVTVSGTTENFVGTAINNIPFGVNISGTTESFNGTAINNIPFGVNISGTTESFNGTAINNIPFGVNISGTSESLIGNAINQIPFGATDWPRIQPFNYNYSVLNILGTGTNNSTNNAFIDSSSNNITISKFDNATQGSFSPYSTAAGAWGVYFDGNGDYISVPASTALDFGTANFTIEGWFYFENATTTLITPMITNYTTWNSAPGTMFFGKHPDASGRVSLYFSNYSASVALLTDSTLPPQNNWVHFAVVRNSSTFTLYRNGVAVSSATWGGSINQANTPTYLNLMDSGVTRFTGYMSNIRVVKGTAVYTNDFPPSTSPLTAISGTSLLLCQSNRFIDNSSNAYTLTISGNTAVNPFSPFFSASSYTPSTQGGSVYLSDIDDFIYNETNIAATTLNTNFTMEGWFYFVDGTANESQAIYTNYYDPYGEGAVFFGKSVDIGGLVSFWTSNFNLYAPLIADTTLPPSNAWTHYAVVKNGTNYQLYRNGVSVASVTWAGTVNTTPGPIFIGTYGSAPGDYILRGYTTDFRIVKSAVYTSNFTPPSTALNAIANTALLIGGRNAGIFDSSFDTVIETLGDAKISTAVSANGSIALDGAGDYLKIPYSVNYNFGAGDFTIEMWIRFNTLVDGTAILTYGWPTVNAPFLLYVDNVNSRISFYSSSNGSTWDIANQTTIISGPAINTWYHIAVTRSGNTFRTFSNGNLVSTISSSASLFVPSSTVKLTVGGGNTGINNVNCYINNLNIQKGTALYVGNFTPPTRS